jgi:hypothetical protein
MHQRAKSKDQLFHHHPAFSPHIATEALADKLSGGRLGVEVELGELPAEKPQRFGERLSCRALQAHKQGS